MKSASWRTPLSGLTVAAALLLVGGAWTPEASAQSTPAGTEADPFIVPFHWGLKPGNIQPGDKFRLMFQTENRRNGSSSTIGDYNSFVQGDAPPGGFHADISPYVSEFKAIVSTEAVDARDNLGATGTGVQINWVNGSKVADDYADFWDGSWDARAPTLGSGVGASGRAIFTGTDNDGTGYTDHQMGTSNPRFGQSRLGSPLSSGNTGNSGTRAFYAMSPVFQVDPAPPPVSVEFSKNLNQGRHQYDYNIEEGATLKPRLTFDPPTRAEATLIIHATGNTATAGVDFPAGPYRVTVPKGATRHTFDIEIPWDAAIEDYETFNLTIGKLPDGFRYDPQNSAMVQIVNVSVVPSDWSLIPSGLGPGDKFRLLFKTATERDAHPSDIAEYDAFVRTRTAAHPWHADIEDYGHTFRVVGSTGAVDGNFHTGSGNIVESQEYPGHTTAYRPVYWLGGIEVAEDYRVFWRGWWDDANAPANQRHADGLAATNTRGPTTGTSYCCIVPMFGAEIHGSGIRTPDPYWLGGSRSTVVKGSGVASPDTGRHVSGRNSIQDEVVRDRPRGEVAPYLALSAVFEVGDFQSTDRVVWIDDGGTPGGAGDSYVGCTSENDPPDCEPVFTEQVIAGTKVRIYEGETATFTVHVDSAPTADLTVQVNVRDTQNYVAADDPDDDVVGEGIQKIVIPSGQTSFTFTVPTIYDNRDDPFGDLIASILPGPGYRVPDGSDASRRNVGIVEVVNFWGLESLSMSEVPGTHETDLNIPFTSAAGGSYTVHYRIVDTESTATQGTGNSADYDIRIGYNPGTNRGTFTVPAGSPSGKLPVWVNDDTRLEGTEKVVLEFTSPANLKPNKITIPIHDNELPAKLKPYADGYAPEIDATLTEGYAPESEHQIRVAGFDYRGRRVGLERAVHYEYCVEGTATLGDDYELIDPDGNKVASAGCHPVTLPATWERMKLLRVKVLDDGLYDEPDETVKIRLRRSRTAGMETDTGLATVPESIRIAGETASVVVTIKDDLPALEVAPCGNRCQVQSGSRARLNFTIRTVSGLSLRTYVKALWEVEDGGDVIHDYRESGYTWLQRSNRSSFDIPMSLRNTTDDGYVVFKLKKTGDIKYRVKNGAGEVCVAVNNGTCPALSGLVDAPPGKVPDTQVADAPVPDAQVANLQVSAVDDDTASATWDAVPHATGYSVEWTGEDGNGQEALAGSRSVAGTATTIEHNAQEALTLSVTVTPEYVDGNGDTQVLKDLAGTATLDVGPDDDGPVTVNPPPDYSDLIAEVRGYAAEGHGDAHVARWKRVLAAFGDDNGHEPMTAAEAEAMADTYSRTRWDPVVEALTELEARTEPDPEPEVTVSAGGDVTEGTPASFTVTATPAPSAPLSVDVTVGQSGDYAASGTIGARTVTVPASGSVTLDIATVDDGTDEPDGSVSVTVDAGSGYTVGGGNTATVDVADDDDPEPDVTVSAGGDVTEGTPASFTVTATPAPSAPLDVDVTVGQSGDYAASGTIGARTVTVPASGSVTLDIATVDDGTDEPDGSVSVSVDAGSGYTVGSAGTASVAVADDDDPPPPPPETCVSDTLRETVTGYSEEGYGDAHVARWKRVLAAFGDDNGHEAMTSAEARDMADNHMRSRWEPVAEAIECLERQRAESSVHVPLVPSASNPAWEGVVRIANPTGQSGEVRVVAIDDAGHRREPVVLEVGSGASVEFNSRDIEGGNALKGLDAGAGPGTGDWRLEISSGVDISVLPYIRGPGGASAPMHDVVEAAGGAHRVSMFNPADDPDGAGLLRLVNRGETPVGADIHGIDDAGDSPGSGVSLDIPARGSVTLGAAELEGGGAGLEGALGDGSGKWRLRVASSGELVVMNLLESPGGHLANLSQATPRALAARDVLAVPAFPPASDASGQRGFVRIVNGSARDGSVTIRPRDSEGRRYEPLTLALGAGEAANLDAWDLELGNAPIGLSGRSGAGLGDWRLEISSELDIKVLAYVLTTTGLVKAADDTAGPDRR